MTERTFHAELTSREFPYNFKELSSTVIFNQGSEIQRGVPGGIQGADSEKSFGVCQAYYLDNVLPISRGYSSIGFTAAVPELDLTSEIIAGFTVRGTGSQIALFVATQTNAYVYDPNGGQWQELELSGTSAELVSYAFVKEVTYIYYGYSVYVYNFDSQELEEVDLIGIDESVIKGIASAGSHLIAWDDTTIYRSSVLNPLDFDPLNGLSTGAGSTKVLAIKGNIIVCLALGEDFVIYTSNNAVSARQTGQLQFPFVYKEIRGSSGIENAQHVAHDSNQGNHISWTASGFQQVGVESAEYIWPELGDGITRGIMSVIDPEFETPLFVRVDSIQVKLNFVSNRWVVVSTRALPFTATATYTDAYVYDTLLGRWGKLTVPHATFLEFSLPEVFSQYTYEQFGTDYQLYSDIPANLVYAQLGDSDRVSASKAGTNFGLLRSNGEVYSVSWAETSEFRGETEVIGAARSRIIMGKFKPFRTRGMIHQSLKVTRLFDANLKLYGHDYTGNYVAIKQDLVQNQNHEGQWFGRLNSDSVSIGLDGVFLLTDLSFVATDAGKINQRFGELQALLIATTDTYPLEEPTSGFNFEVTEVNLTQGNDGSWNWFPNQDDGGNGTPVGFGTLTFNYLGFTDGVISPAEAEGFDGMAFVYTWNYDTDAIHFLALFDSATPISPFTLTLDGVPYLSSEASYEPAGGSGAEGKETYAWFIGFGGDVTDFYWDLPVLINITFD